MANPQKEDGHIDIANEIAEALARWNLSSYEQRILWVVFRKTYGWHKKEDWISLSQFSVATGISRPHVCRSLKLLTQQNIITKGGNTYSPLYRFQKDFDKWKLLPKGVTSHKLLPKWAMGVTKGGNQVLPKGAHTKETITKETIQKKYSADGALVIKSFESIDSKNKTYYNNKTQREASDFLLSEYGLERINLAIELIKKKRGSVGFPSITSPYEMKEKWSKIGEAIIREQSHSKNNQPNVIFS